MTIHEKFGKPKYPYCELGTEEFLCANDYAFNYLLNASSAGECLRPCKINEYFGRVTYYDDKWGRDTAFSYYYKPPEAKYIEEEYLIYDDIGVLSAVGGILGLLLGFSLKGIIKSPNEFALNNLMNLDCQNGKSKSQSQ